MTISYDDFSKLQLRVATISACSPDSAGKLTLDLDLGDGIRRQIPVTFAGQLAPEQFAGKQIIAIANYGPLAPQPSTPPAAAPQPEGAAPAPVAPAPLSPEDLAKVEFRVADVLECKAHPNADKLLILQIAVGEERRQICAGLRAYYQPEQLAGRRIIIVANLEPRKMRGEISQGMLLAATDAASGRVIILTPAEAAASGSAVATTQGFMVIDDQAAGRAILVSLAEPVAAGSGVK